jgi:hypothetical protein
METNNSMLKLKKLGFINVKKGAAHCLISPEKKEILHAYSWPLYILKCESFLR